MGRSFEIMVREYSIGEIVKNLRNTWFLVVPSFQRGYRWKEKDIVNLLDSIVKGYPIGHIIVWETGDASIVEEIDPFAKPLISVEPSGKTGYIVVDGQQRLISLGLLFHNFKITRGDETVEIEPISYDITRDRFLVGEKRGIRLDIIIDAYIKGESKALRELLGKLPETELEKVRNLAIAIRDYKIPFYIIRTSRIDEDVIDSVIEAFIRVNKYGTPIKGPEIMMSYLTKQYGGRLKNGVEKIYKEIGRRYKIDLEPILRFIISCLNIKQSAVSDPKRFKASLRKASETLETTQLDKFTSNVTGAFRLTIDFLRKIGISSGEILPTQIPLIILSRYFYEAKITDINTLSDSELKDMENWFVLVSFHGYYSSKTNTKIDNDIKTLAGKGRFPYNELINNIEKSKLPIKIRFKDIERGKYVDLTKKPARSYLFLLYMLLVKNNATDWSGILIHSCKWESLARHHIFPRKVISENIDLEDYEDLGIYAGNLGNITIINGGVNSEIGESKPIDYLEKYINQLPQHMIPVDKELWRIDNYEEFINRRIHLIYENAKKHYPEIVE